MIGCLAVLLLALTYFAVEKFPLARHATTDTAVPASAPVGVTPTQAPPEKSVAVLPFIDMSEKKDQEYISDGLSEELICKLAQVQDLRVPAHAWSHADCAMTVCG